MTNTAQRGRSSRLYGKFQSAFDTPASGDFQAFNFYSESLAAADTLQDDRELGAEVDNDRDATDPAPGLQSASGSIEVPADLNQLLFWLRLAFGDPATTDEDPNFTHVFTSGAALLPSASLEIPLNSNRFKLATGVSVNAMTFGVSKESGYRTFSVDVMARTCALAGATAAGTPSSLPARAKVPASIGVVRLNSVISGAIVGGDFTLNNNLEAINYADDAASASAHEPGDFAFSGSPRLRFKRGAALNGALDIFADEATPFDLEVEYALGANQSLLIKAPRCFAPKTTPVIAGAGPVDFEPAGPIMAKQTTGGSAAPAVTVTLKNQLDGTLGE